MNLTLICASNNEEILKRNFLKSFATLNNETLVMRGIASVQTKYNQAMDIAKGDILCFIHQDVWLPPTFENNLRKSLETLYNTNWGVLGVAGKLGEEYVGFMLDRNRVWGSTEGLPREVQTLDELLLIIKRDTFRFDEAIPTHHMIGVDLCMQSHEVGKSVWAINAYCHHNSNQERPTLPEEFQLSVNYMSKKWKHRLPINTTCGTLVA